MLNKILVLCLTVTMLCLPLLAQDSDRVPQIAITTASPIIHPLDADTTGLVKIYSSLGSKTDAYDDKLGWAVSGPASKLGTEQWMALLFIPQADVTVKEIRIPVGWDGPGYGNNGFTLSINSGSATLPGKPLHQWAKTNLFLWGKCCSLDVAHYKTGIKLKKGQNYWIVARTGPNTMETLGAWGYTWNHIMGTLSYNLGQGWKPYPNQVVPAIAIFGTKP